MNRFDYVRYDNTAIIKHAEFKMLFVKLAEKMEEELSNIHATITGSAQKIALIKLEESYMWVGKAIRDEMLMRGKDGSQ